MYLYIILAGFAGGALRGLVGFTKYQFSYKNVKFNLNYFLAMTAISGVTGLVTAMVAKELGVSFLGLALNPALAFVVGYAGGDLLENIYKIIIKKPSLYSAPIEVK
ncbi:MAG: hypothetical protein V1892_00545 [bacterium]